MSTLAWRRDIDGLRGIAVLGVVLYHLDIGPLHGGFAGVDVFFVISGYLITGIVQRQIDAGEFTFAGFYERRMRRIFPALFAMLFATLIVGASLLLPSDLVALGKSSLATLVFGSNVLFWRQSDYFGVGYEHAPLLHTWSLAVEEQFYVVLPIALFALRRISRHSRIALLTAGTAVSFVLCVCLRGEQPTAVFFLLPFRAWELLAGGLVAVGDIPAFAGRMTRTFIALVALIALIGSLCWVESGPGYPGWQAAIPVAATVALLHAGANGDSIVKRLLSLRPLAFVGLISYSLYLWHWPLVFYARYRHGLEPLSPATRLAVLSLAIALAAVSYRWVESPFRQRTHAPSRIGGARLFAGVAVTMFVLVVASATVQLRDGWQFRFSPQVMALDSAQDSAIPFLVCQGMVPPAMRGHCKAGDPTSHRRVLLWGDSYASAWAPAFDELGKRMGLAVDLAWLSQCPGLVGVAVSAKPSCQAFNSAVAAKLQSGALGSIDAIVLVAHWGPYLQDPGGIALASSQTGSGNADAFAAGLARTIAVARAAGARVIIIGPTPGGPENLAIAKQYGSALPKGFSVAQAQAHDAGFWNAVDACDHTKGVSLVDPSVWFANGATYRYLDSHGNPLYRDGGHLSLAGAAFVAQRFPAKLLNHGGP